ncbi:hypothetical protein ABW19_dt0207822 [Dactylella cylindrospora]|nr:hypothetical protein ABW19_dt0207822 [Dactylella cylindrospora]
MQQTLRHNVIERERVIVPPSWDSWGKIRVLRDFDVEGVGSGWSIDIDFRPPASSSETPNPNVDLDAPVEGGAVELYEEVIRDSRSDDQLAALSLRPKGAIEMPPVDIQEFLASQLEILESKKEDERAVGLGGPGGGRNAMGTVGLAETDSRVRDHVGPVQFNVGGIQVDADDMLRRIKDRDAASSLDPNAPGYAAGGGDPTSPGGAADGKSQNEVLAQFFSSLMNKKSAGAKTGPGGGGKA